VALIEFLQRRTGASVAPVQACQTSFAARIFSGQRCLVAALPDAHSPVTSQCFAASSFR
jgi:hypothetical protein